MISSDIRKKHKHSSMDSLDPLDCVQTLFNNKAEDTKTTL